MKSARVALPGRTVMVAGGQRGKRDDVTTDRMYSPGAKVML
jgi:hypothetical protein